MSRLLIDQIFVERPDANTTSEDQNPMRNRGKIVKREDFTDDDARYILSKFPNAATRKNPWVDATGLDVEGKAKPGRKPKAEVKPKAEAKPE